MQQPLFVTEEKRLEQEKKKIRISVRNLVEFLLRSGDLDNRRGGVSDKDAMQAGTRAHQRIQKKMGPFYQAEVSLVFEKEYENFILRVEGRADAWQHLSGRSGGHLFRNGDHLKS